MDFLGLLASANPTSEFADAYAAYQQAIDNHNMVIDALHELLILDNVDETRVHELATEYRNTFRVAEAARDVAHMAFHTLQGTVHQEHETPDDVMAKDSYGQYL